ncbi:MAG: single-stranded-DNA-specific exonuclease RecJ [Candidatus Peribacteraceae bacterium]
MPPSFSFTGKRWIVPDNCIIADAQTHPQQLLLALCHRRGIQLQKVEDVLPPFGELHDALRATSRIYEALKKQEHIGIFGDYDCDGVTATAQLVRFLQRHGTQPFVRLPHRVHDGYGLKMRIIDECLAQDVNLLITVDTGITAVEEIRHAQQNGMDVIITDHHRLHEEVPPAYAIVHPALSSTLRDPNPSGSAVVFHLLRALEGDEWDGRDTDLCLAMLGTIADVMELRGHNRLLIQQGLTALRTLAPSPLVQLIEQAGLKPATVTSRDIAFRIAPRINAAGRIDDPLIALEALLLGGDALASLEELNERRQRLTESFFAEALTLLGITPLTKKGIPHLLAIAHEEFPQGILGLIAGKLTEMFGKPSLVACVHGDTCTASLRSTPAYHITDGLMRHSDLLTYYGGHAQAAGCTFPLKNFPELSRRLQKDIQERTTSDELTPSLTLDAVLPPSLLHLNLARALENLEPFGASNPEPLFCIRNIRMESLRCVGSDGAHLQCSISGKKGIGFGLGHLTAQLQEPVDIACRIGINEWNGRIEPQIFLEDIRRTEQRNQKLGISNQVSAKRGS